MNSRERVVKVLAGEIPDRVPLDDRYWQTTLERWRREGLPADVAPADYFGLDFALIGGDYSLRFPERLVAQTEDSRTYWDSMGALRKDLRTATGWTSQWLDFTIKTRDDWYKYRHRLRYDPSRIPDSALASYRRARAQGKFICYSSHLCFHPTWAKIGMERELMLLLEDAEWMHEMFAAHTTLILEIYDALQAMGIVFDGGFLADDLGYQVSPLISPKLYRELVFPYHKRVCDHLGARGQPVILHSDGNVAPLIPHFLEAGFRGLHPLEAKAGLDVRQLKPLYGDRLVLVGNIDVRKLSGSREEIEAEIASKVTVAKEGGGYIYHSDHSVPNTVSLENYRFALQMVRRYGSYA